MTNALWTAGVGLAAIGIFHFAFPPSEKIEPGRTELRSGIRPKECLAIGGKVQYYNDDPLYGVRGCWVRYPAP